MDISYLKHSYKYIVAVWLLIAITSCNPNLDYDIKGYTQKIIVEASIGDGSYPVVYLSLNNPVWKKVDSVTIMQNVIRYAKVTVSDGKNSEILTSGWDLTHFPPYKYAGTELCGEAGKRYTIKVEYSGYTIESETTIPQPGEILSFETEAVSSKDSLRKLFMNLDMKDTPSRSYMLKCKNLKDKHYNQVDILYNQDLQLTGTHRYQIIPTALKTDKSYEHIPYFAKGDTLIIRLSTIDSISTAFFRDFTIFSSTTGVANMFLNSEKQSLKSNISKPGFGIWYGEAVRYYEYIIP